MEKVVEPIEQLCVGSVIIGTAGIDRKRKEQGYICHICSVDSTERAVDLAVTEKQLRALGERIAEFLDTSY